MSALGEGVVLAKSEVARSSKKRKNTDRKVRPKPITSSRLV